MKILYALWMGLLILSFSCQKQTTEPEIDKHNEIGNAVFKMDLTNAPLEVIKIRGQLTRAEYDTIRFEFIIQGDSAIATVQNVTSGNWYLKVDAYNAENRIIYSGATRVYVYPGITMPVYIQLNPVTGNLEITVTWGGEQRFNPQILFYSFPINSATREIYTIDIDGQNLSLIAGGRSCYPIWFDGKSKIVYQDLDSYSLMMKNLANTLARDSLITPYDENIMFLRYSTALNCFFFSYYDQHGLSRIGKMDTQIFTLQPINDPIYDERYPVPSPIDDWIYFSTNPSGTFNIYRMKSNGSQHQFVLGDSLYNYHTFSLSSDGKFLVTPMYNDQQSYIVLYNLERNIIKLELDLSNYGTALYTSLTSDYKYILFVFGKPNDYTISRNLFRINSDGTNLTQLTFFRQTICGRPLHW
jgi:hypothetical protein